jgi:insertion element IS1 protein InsB
VDEMWSFVSRKRGQRWLWGALDQQTGRIVASVCGRREDRALLALKRLLAPFGIRRSYTDGRGTYRRQRRTHRRERKHLTLRIRIKRLVRKTICFSRSVHMHDIVLRLFSNRFDFGVAVSTRVINCIGTSRVSADTDVVEVHVCLRVTNSGCS